MDESCRTDRRSVQLIFEADRQAADLLSIVYRRLLVSGDASAVPLDGVQDGEARVVPVPLMEEVKS